MFVAAGTGDRWAFIAAARKAGQAGRDYSLDRAHRDQSFSSAPGCAWVGISGVDIISGRPIREVVGWLGCRRREVQ